MSVEIRRTTEEDLKKLAKIHTNTYAIARPDRGWTTKKSHNFISWYLELAPDLVLTAVKDKKIVGCIIGVVEPNHDGAVLMLKDMFVDPSAQNQSIGSKLLYRLIQIAELSYGVTKVIAATYENKNGYPFKWYEKLGFTRSTDDFLISREIKDLTEKIYESRNHTFYKLLNQYINILQEGQTIQAIYTMHKDEFDDSPYETEYANNNIKAAKRNVRIERIIIVPEKDKEAALNNKIIRAQMKEPNIHLYYLSTEKIDETNQRLFAYINDGFVVFDELALFIDMRAVKEMTGVYSFDKKDITRNKKVFRRLKAIAEKII